jgi:heptosyltransferase-1
MDRSRVLCAHALDYRPDGPESYGLRAQAQAVDLALDAAADPSPTRPIALVHGSSREDKLWPEPLWIDLGQALIARGASLALPHGNALEEARAQRIAQALGPSAQVWPRLDLGALIDRLAASAGVIGVDSGLSHLATALDLPHVQIYNHDTAWRTGPVQRPRQRSVYATPHPACAEVLAVWDEVARA